MVRFGLQRGHTTLQPDSLGSLLKRAPPHPCPVPSRKPACKSTLDRRARRGLQECFVMPAQAERSKPGVTPRRADCAVPSP